jgi:hypothetical protein
MREFPKAWAAPGAALRLGATPLHSTPVDADEMSPRRPLARAAVATLSLTRYWSVLSSAAAGWATLAIAYCPWHLVPESPQEFGIVLFGAVAGGAGALAMLLHPEERTA